MIRPCYEIIEAYTRAGDLVVAAPATALGARIAQEKLGVPLATVHLQPALIRSVHEPPVYGCPDVLGHLSRPLRRLYLRLADRLVIDKLLGAKTNAFRRNLGLPSVTRLFDGWLHSPQLVLGFFPDWYAPPQRDWPPNARLPGFALHDESDSRRIPAKLEDFLAAGDPPVVFTFGSAMARGAEVFRISAEVCRSCGWRGIFLTQFAEQLPEKLPEGVLHFGDLPCRSILPRAAALVHDGGIGTVGQSLAAGVHQLVVPFAHDQPDNAGRVRRLGVGDRVLTRHYSVPAVSRRLEELLTSPTVGENCRLRKAQLVGHNAIDLACEMIESPRPR